jgi:hypothetical protein
MGRNGEARCHHPAYLSSDRRRLRWDGLPYEPSLTSQVEGVSVVMLCAARSEYPHLPQLAACVTLVLQQITIKRRGECQGRRNCESEQSL